MYKNISVHNKNTHLRSTIICFVLLFIVIFGGVSIITFFKGNKTLAENSSGLVPGCDGTKCYQELFAYLKPGETIEAKLTAIPLSESGPREVTQEGQGGSGYCTTLGQAISSIYCNPGYPISLSPESAKVTITGPNGVSYTAHFDENFNLDDPALLAVSASSQAADSTKAAVWRIKIDQDPALNMRFRWEVYVLDGAVKKPGRIWTDEVLISQINSKELPVSYENGTKEYIDLVYYAQRSEGYRYKITQKGYNGFGSTLKVGAFGVGLPSETGCVSAYGSVEIPIIEWAESYAPTYIPDPLGKQGKSLDNIAKCAGLANYRLFFEEPAADLPSDPVPDWNDNPVLNIYKSDPDVPKIAAYFESTNKYEGNAVIANFDSYYGNAILELDTDGNSTDNFDIKIPFGIAESITKIPLDGTKNNNGGTPIPLGTLVKGRVLLEYLGEIHIISLDIEERAGGIETQRLNGSAEKTYNLFWNDDITWLSATRATITPQFKSVLPAGTSSQGGVHDWTMPITYSSCTDSYNTWNISESMKTALTNNHILCPFDIIGHFNQYAHQSWGDNRAIEDWTYDIDATDLWKTNALANCNYSNDDEDICFSYIFNAQTVDVCAMTDTAFDPYYNNLATESEKTAALAKRAACSTAKEPSCSMTLTELEAVLGSYDAAVAYWQTCESGEVVDPPYKPPTTGAERYYF